MIDRSLPLKPVVMIPKCANVSPSLLLMNFIFLYLRAKYARTFVEMDTAKRRAMIKAQATKKKEEGS